MRGEGGFRLLGCRVVQVDESFEESKRPNSKPFHSLSRNGPASAKSSKP